MTERPAETAEEVLAFWFAPETEPNWFVSDPAFDAHVRRVLLPAHERAAAGALRGWLATAGGALALILLLDQVPRNAFRGSPRAFATDAEARAAARVALARGFDLARPVRERPFFYLPFEHAEDLDDQRLSVALFRERVGEGPYLDYAVLHLRVIERFGRFPHRNAVLGRESSEAERAWLADHPQGF
ncbi:MAG: DUF924 family protein [Acetobacteraceae bacterium]|nr:DUF924 family protein [Acetobacteraceae bacterium]